jgi:hypothetical protein
VRVRKLYQMREKQSCPAGLGLDRADKEKWNTLVEKYRLIETQQDGLTAADAARASGSRTFDLTARREKRTFSQLSLVAEVSRYLNRSPLEIEELLDATKEGTDELVAITNEFNELLYDEIIPRLFRLLFDLDEYEKRRVRGRSDQAAPNGYYEVSAQGQDRADARRADQGRGAQELPPRHLLLRLRLRELAVLGSAARAA